MNRRPIARITSVLSVVGVIASAAALLVFLSKTLKFPEVTLSIVSLSLGVLSGSYSAYLAGLAKKIVPSRRVFISYSHDDQRIAKEITQALRTRGARVWLDQERLKVGEPIHEAVEHGIRDADAFVVLLSKRQSPSLLLELRIARDNGLRIIPVLVSEGELPADLRGLRYIDLRHERSQGLEELMKAAT